MMLLHDDQDCVVLRTFSIGKLRIISRRENVNFVFPCVVLRCKEHCEKQIIFRVTCISREDSLFQDTTIQDEKSGFASAEASLDRLLV